MQYIVTIPEANNEFVLLQSKPMENWSTSAEDGLRFKIVWEEMTVPFYDFVFLIIPSFPFSVPLPYGFNPVPRPLAASDALMWAGYIRSSLVYGPSSHGMYNKSNMIPHGFSHPLLMYLPTLPTFPNQFYCWLY